MKQTAIVTGGSRGIGFAIAKQLGQDGFNIVIMDMNDQSAYQDNLDQLTAQGTEYLYLKGNICDAGDRQRLIDETVAKFGGIHVLVNNAGVSPKVRADLLEMSEESFDRVVGINTKGNMFMTQAVAKQMLKQDYIGRKRGTIVNISSCSAVVSSISRGEYCVSKAGVSMLTTLYADRLAPEGILVHEVRPGVIATDMTATVKEKYDKMFADGLFPIARWGTPEDIAGVVSAFCSDKFTYTTGNYVDVDGGFHIQRL
ncbi:MAG TPA: 3-ketoacyl-ACP reductase [Candidatus Galloscillospira excrementavium]|nr:3-ketoacyl-ACP reductase [Candidatus Galloscillospira excrementavium]